MMRHTDYVSFSHGLQKTFAPRCIEYALNVVHNYLRFFAEQGRLRFPLYLARVPRGYAQSYEAVTEEEYQKIVAVLKAEKAVPLRDLAMIMLLHDTGMRVGELVSLEIEDIEEDYSAVIHTEKTVRDRRVFWNPGTDDIIQRYLVERVNNGDPENDALFIAQISRKGKSPTITKRTVERMFQIVLKKAEINRKLCPHSFRHSFIHRLAKLGVPDAIIAQLVGHSTPNTISNYTKLSRPEFKDYAHKQLAFANETLTALAV